MVGEQLRSARVASGLRLEDLSEATKIRALVIESMELDDFEPCGGRVYARGQVKSLALILGINVEEILATFDAQCPEDPQ